MTLDYLLETECEDHCIALALVAPTELPEMVTILTPRDFSDGNRAAWESIVTLFEAGEEVNHLTVAAHMAQRNTLVPFGGNTRFLDIIRGLPMQIRGDWFALEVKHHAISRDLLRMGTAIQRLVMDRPDDPFGNMERARAILDGIAAEAPRSDTRTASEVLRGGLWDELEVRMENPTAITGVPTGWTIFDRVTRGLRRKAVYLYGAETSLGKSLFADDVIRRVAQAGYRVMVFTTEMGADEVATRIIYQIAGFDPMSRTTAYTSGDRQRLRDAMEAFDALPIVFCDRGDLSFGYLRAETRRIKAKHGAIDLVVVDHIDMVSGDGGQRTQELEAITRGIKGLAMGEELAVLEVSHLSRVNDFNKGTKSARFRNSETKAGDADVGWTMTPIAPDGTPLTSDVARNEMAETGRMLMELDIFKCRGGRTGKLRMLLNWEQGGRFFEVTR